jgi:hypothetical protein
MLHCISGKKYSCSTGALLGAHMNFLNKQAEVETCFAYNGQVLRHCALTLIECACCQYFPSAESPNPG